MRSRPIGQALVAAIASVIGLDELAVAAALAVLLAGLWPRFGRESLIVAGAVLLWLFLPARAPFLLSSGEKTERTKR